MHNVEKDMKCALGDFWRHSLYLMSYDPKAVKIKIVGDTEEVECIYAHWPSCVTRVADSCKCLEAVETVSIT
jgi:hypothetical protein